MREILFRGKTEQGKWIFGFYHNETSIESPASERKITRHHIYTKDFDKFVIPETIGQFTGLTDKNGKKIFEGDIIRLTPPKESGEIYIPTPRNPQEDRILKVIFFDGMFAVDMSKWFKYGHGKVALQTYETNRIEVIGNIYDNPELLEVK